MAGPLIGPRLRAVALVLPLVAFIGLTFVAPLATMLSRSVYDPVVADALPETLGLLRDWDGAQTPPEPVFEAVARELRKAREERTLGRIAARVNRVRGGLRTVITRTARRLREAESPSWRDTLVGVHDAWDEVQTWHAIRQAGRRFTDRHYLHALDLERQIDGRIAPRPAEFRVYLPLLWRTLVVSLSLTVLCLLLGYPVAYLIAHSPPRRANLLLLLVPFWTSLLVRTTAWIVLLQTQGVVNSALVALNLIADDSRLAMIYNMTGHGRHDPRPVALHGAAAVRGHAHHPAAAHERCGVAGRQHGPGVLAGLLAAEPAGRRRRLVAGLHPGHRLLHHARAGRRPQRSAHFQHDRLPHAEFPELGARGGARRSPPGLRAGAVSGVQPAGGNRTDEAGLR